MSERSRKIPLAVKLHPWSRNPAAVEVWNTSHEVEIRVPKRGEPVEVFIGTLDTDQETSRIIEPGKRTVIGKYDMVRVNRISPIKLS